MSFDTITPIMNGRNAVNGKPKDPMEEWNARLSQLQEDPEFHGDTLLADKQVKLTGLLGDLWRVLSPKNAPEVFKVAVKALSGKGLDVVGAAQLVGSMPNDSKTRDKLVQSQVQTKYDKMLHPPLTYLGDAFQYRAADGKFNSVLSPHLGQAGAPYAKTVPSKTHPLGALPDPGDLFDRLMAREEGGRESASGLSSMLVYHATIIIHDIFRTNVADKNISDSSSYLDLSPLYGYSMDMQRKVRDGQFKLGLLKPDTFAEDRLLRQPPGVCIVLVMYNRYHNYAATQLKRINENGRFSVPAQYEKSELLAIADSDCVPSGKRTDTFAAGVQEYEAAWKEWSQQGQKDKDTKYEAAKDKMTKLLNQVGDADAIKKFGQAHEAAWNKLDDDLFNTARLITCGMYVNVSIHDYLRALMGFHQYNTNFTLDPRVAMTDHQNVSRGLGNQVTVEFNLLYRFHCAISLKDEQYTESFIKEAEKVLNQPVTDPKSLSMRQFATLAAAMGQKTTEDPSLQEFGLKNSPTQNFTRNTITGLFDDQKMIDQLRISMDDPISNFGPRNVPRALKNVEILGILQARKWEIGTLNDFRDFFRLGRHETFESITKNKKIQEALRDLYDHPDKVELYPGIFCESDANMGVDPGPSDVDSALWSAIFSDAITLVRSDRFYTVDWNTKSLTSWGMKEVTPENEILKSSVFHRLLQRAFPEWFPYDSIRFFHPFYTSKQNANFAKQQGYFADFAVKETHSPKAPFDVQASNPQKPNKPIFLNKYKDIRSVLQTGADEIIHPAFTQPANLPKKVEEALRSIKSKAANDKKGTPDSLENEHNIKAYFSAQMRAIVEREVIIMQKNKEGSIFQVDVTRDLAIPVVTRCVADFLGFGHQIRNVGNTKAKYSENEIYQHITNCQVFLAYNTDETKLLKRRAAFKKSMDFLLKLAESGNILEASRWRISKACTGLLKRPGNDTTSEPMKALGRSVAARILEDERDSGKAAALLLLCALDVAYMSVLAFTSALDCLLQGAYDLANSGGSGSCDWFETQKLALEDNASSDRKIEAIILDAQKRSVKLPFVRKVVKDGVEITVNHEKRKVDKGQTIVCDIYEAMNTNDGDELKEMKKYGHLNYLSSLSEATIHFNPKDIAVHGLTAMLKVMAQMKDLRRGHTSQGLVKKIEIDQTYEGYANFMAPGRMEMIAYDVKTAASKLEAFEDALKKDEEPAKSMGEDKKKAHLELLKRRVEDAPKVFDKDVLKPKANTFLTAEWDEMIPFPTTWKLRFEGYGKSTYGKDLIKLRPEPQPDSAPPYYQPQGASHYGGTFGDKQDVTDTTPADKVAPIAQGCGAPVPVLHSAPPELNAVQTKAW